MKLLNKIGRLLYRKPRYEFLIFEGNQIMVDKDLNKLQEDGWELAGEIQTRYSDSFHHRMLIPLKRKLQ